MSKYFTHFFLLLLLLALCACAAMAQSAPAPALLGGVDKASGWVDAVYGFLSSKEGIATTVGSVLFAIAKAASNQKAGPIVAVIQGFFDGVAKLLTGVAKLFTWVAAFLGNLIKSDGILGKL